MTNIKSILSKSLDFSLDDIKPLLSVSKPEEVKLLQEAAYDLTTKSLGNKVYYRGIVEFSNICSLDCYYCGIRKSNKSIDRFILEKKEIVDAAIWCAKMGYGSCVLQSGERSDKNFTNFVIDCIKEIKENTKSEVLPEGLGITLSVGEQDKETYQRFYDAGAHRYLLRIETSNQELFSKLHPENQTLESRIQSIELLKEIGFQVGTGIMIGIPGQSIEDIAKDIELYKKLDIDMIGMGPFISHKGTPLAGKDVMDKAQLLQLSLSAIAITRLYLTDVNIASTTALQALFPTGREKGIEFGANVIMPNLTPVQVREQYKLYDGKPCLDEAKEDCLLCLKMRVEHANRKVGWNEWGDSIHYEKRQEILS